MALKAAGRRGGAPAEGAEEDAGTLMQHPPAGAQQQAWGGAAPAAGATAMTRGRRLGASYTDADAELFRLHYDAVGRYFAERVGSAAAAAATAGDAGRAEQEGAPPPSSAASHWARTPLGRCTPRTVELVTSLAAFRTGLQVRVREAGGSC